VCIHIFGAIHEQVSYVYTVELQFAMLITSAYEIRSFTSQLQNEGEKVNDIQPTAGKHLFVPVMVSYINTLVT